MTTDFDITDHGSIVILAPVSTDARDWIDENLDPETQWFGRGAAIERRYFEAIYDGITNDGLTVA